MRNHKLLLNSCLTIGATLSCLPAARAQMATASQQVDTVNQRQQMEQTAQSLDTNNVPALYDTETDDVGPQSVLAMKTRRTWFQGYADIQFFYTDNMFMADHGQTGADVMVSTAMAALAPTPYAFHDGQLAPRLGYQYQWFNYDLVGSKTVLTPPNISSKLDLFDFNASTVFADATWQRQNWQFTLGGDFRELMDSSSYNVFYREGVPRWSASYNFNVCPKTSLSLGYAGDYRVTDIKSPVPAGPFPLYFGVHFNDRTDQGLFIVGNWRLCDYAMLQPYYTFTYSHYTRIDRDDFLHSFGLALYCPLTKNFTARAFVGYNDLNTDGYYSQNYEELNAGGGLNLSARF